MISRTASLALCVLLGMAWVHVDGRGQESAPTDAARRITERLAALRAEADALAGREKTLLNELQALEIQRRIKAAELAALRAEAAATQEKLATATNRAAVLRATASAQQPDVEDRLVRLYKMGRAGYWRLLLDVDDLQSMGRAYRTASTLTQQDRSRVERHAQTLKALEQQRSELQTRANELNSLQGRSATAQAALDAAVASRAALVKSIGSRRDLAAQLASELDAAHLQLQSALAQNPGGAVVVPLRPFRGEIPWPADGIVIGRFGRQRVGRMAGIEFSRNGIELSLAEGRPVSAVHEGVVTQAGPFTGYGQLVVIDHGNGAASLYGHLESISVNKGARVSAGSQVGLSGRNPGGNPSLYFELRIDGKPVDPLQWLRRSP